MVRTVGDDKSEQKVIDDIAEYGWHCVNIMAEGEQVEYSFTVGLHQTYGHPELIIFWLARKSLTPDPRNCRRCRKGWGSTRLIPTN